MTKGRTNVWTCVHKVLTSRWTAASFQRKRLKSGGTVGSQTFEQNVFNPLASGDLMVFSGTWSIREATLSIWLVERWSEIVAECMTVHNRACSSFPSFKKTIYMRKRRFSSFQHICSVTQDGCCSLLRPPHQSSWGPSLPLINRGKKHQFYSLAILWMITFLQN